MKWSTIVRKATEQKGKEKVMAGLRAAVGLFASSTAPWLCLHLAGLIEQASQHLVSQAWLSWKQKAWQPMQVIFIFLVNYLEVWKPSGWGLQDQCGSQHPGGRKSLSGFHWQWANGRGALKSESRGQVPALRALNQGPSVPCCCLCTFICKDKLREKNLSQEPTLEELSIRWCCFNPWENQTVLVLFFMWAGKRDQDPTGSYLALTAPKTIW